MKIYLNALTHIWQDLLFKIAGTLFPFYVGAIILYFLKREDILKIFDSQSFILFSATFIFSTFYLWYKTLDSKKSGILILLFFLIISIIISLLYSFSLVDFENTKGTEGWSYFIFFVTLLFYIYYECKSFIVMDNNKFYQNTEEEYDSLDNSFDNFKEEQDGK